MAETRVKLRFRVMVVVVLLLPLVSLFLPGDRAVAAPGASPKDTATNVTVSSGSTAVGGTVTTAITVNGYALGAGGNNGQGLGAYDLKINFDSTRLQITAVQGSSTAGSPFAGTPTNNMTAANNYTGQFSFSAFHTSIPGPVGPTIQLARITWRVTAGPGPYTLALTVTTLADTAGANVTGVGGGSPTAVNGTISVVSPPVASFTKTASTGSAPLTVSFTDTSTGPPSSWSWSFGDGTTSAAQNPARTYNTAGNFTVTLTVTNAVDSSSTSQTVNVYSTPVASFTASPTTTNAGVSIAFTDSSTGNITGWSWNFGDGTTSNLQNPAKSYAADGTYTVSLTVTNPAGTNTLTRTGYIKVSSYQAETSMTHGYDNYAYIGGKINRFFNPVSGNTVTLTDGLGAFDASMSYDAAGVSIKAASGLAPFNSPTVNLDTAGGTRTNVVALQTGSSPQSPIELFRLYPWLTGSKDTAYTVTLRFNTISRGNATEVPQQSDVSKTFRRGDANGSGSVNITDALFITQYLAGLRGLGETSTTVNPLNAATPRNDSATAGSRIDIGDAMYIAQMLAGLRDASYNFTY